MEETVHPDFLKKKQYFYNQQTVPQAIYRIIDDILDINHEQHTHRSLLTMLAEVLYRILKPLNQHGNPVSILEMTDKYIHDRMPRFGNVDFLSVVWLVGEEYDVNGDDSIKALERATEEPPAWIFDYQIVKKYFVSHLKTMDNCLFIYMNMEGLKIADADPAKTVHEARLINNFGRKWGKQEFPNFEEFKVEFLAAMDANFGGEVGAAGPDFSGPVSTAGSSFVVPIALALTFLFIAQGLN